MTLEATNDAMATDDDLKTTVPNMRPDEWKMPDPVFKKTSGRLPKPFERKAGAGDTSAPEVVSDPLGSYVQTPEPSPKSPVLKLVIVALALAAMIAFIALFLTFAYFFYLRSTGSE